MNKPICIAMISFLIMACNDLRADSYTSPPPSYYVAQADFIGIVEIEGPRQQKVIDSQGYLVATVQQSWCGAAEGEEVLLTLDARRDVHRWVDMYFLIGYRKQDLSNDSNHGPWRVYRHSSVEQLLFPVTGQNGISDADVYADRPSPFLVASDVQLNPDDYRIHYIRDRFFLSTSVDNLAGRVESAILESGREDCTRPGDFDN